MGTRTLGADAELFPRLEMAGWFSAAEIVSVHGGTWDGMQVDAVEIGVWVWMLVSR